MWYHELAQVLGRVERMGMETIAMLARQPQNVLVNTGYIDRHRIVVRARRKERRHQRKIVILALERELLAAFRPAFEDLLQRKNVLAQLRHRRIPFDAVTPLDMSFDLCAEPKDEAALREGRKVPSGIGRRHRTARERDRDRWSHFDAGRMFSGQRQRQKSIIAGFHRPYRIETKLLGLLRLSGHAAQVASSNTGIEFHLISPPANRVFQGSRIVTEALVCWKLNPLTRFVELAPGGPENRSEYRPPQAQSA